MLLVNLNNNMHCLIGGPKNSSYAVASTHWEIKQTQRNKFNNCYTSVMETWNLSLWSHLFLEPLPAVIAHGGSVIQEDLVLRNFPFNENLLNLPFLECIHMHTQTHSHVSRCGRVGSQHWNPSSLLTLWHEWCHHNYFQLLVFPSDTWGNFS